jgi:HAD superfamily hydrolase (TIGR01484 family)
LRPIRQIPIASKIATGYVLADIDDTLTIDGRLPSVALAAMEQLQKAGKMVLPVTGRPAGWCDHIARMWPVDGVVGENGAFYFRYDSGRGKMQRRYWRSESQRQKDRCRLEQLKRKILKEISGCAISADQAYREADLAIDFCEDVPRLPRADIDRIVALFRQAGAQAKISSIHVNGWFGRYNKLAMVRVFFAEILDQNLEAIRNRICFIGDSPNDEPMFAFFPCSVGVANVKRFASRMAHPPNWITIGRGGHGFAEFVDVLLCRANASV